MIFRLSHPFFISALSAVSIFIVFCQSSLADNIPVLEVQRSLQNDDVSYVSGGIGFAERDYLDSIVGDFNLKIETALVSGEFIANVSAQILSQDHAVLDTTLDGPQLLVRLPAGRYVVRLSYGKQTQDKTVQVTTKGLPKLMFIFKDEEKDPVSSTNLPPMTF